MNKQFKDSINQSYEEAIKAMEEGQSIKVIRLSLLECAARLEAVANRDGIDPNEYCEIYEQVMLAYKVKFGG